MFSAFGLEPAKLSPEEAITATVDQRIGSVWHYIIRKANQFVETLSRRERANYDVEDVLTEVYLELRTKDARWEPDRGNYLTFAAKIASRCMSNIRDRARTVESPRNSSCRLAQYQAAEDRGSITDRQAKTFLDVKRTARVGEIGHGGSQASGAEPTSIDDSVEAKEQERLINDAIVWGIMALTPFESMVIGAYSGLRGKEPKTLDAIAEQTSRPIRAVKQAKESAIVKIRQRLVSMGHPAIASDN
jgi:RNA polymerase sigma factor (sigma-70 family)